MLGAEFPFAISETLHGNPSYRRPSAVHLPVLKAEDAAPDCPTRLCTSV